MVGEPRLGAKAFLKIFIRYMDKSWEFCFQTVRVGSSDNGHWARGEPHLRANGDEGAVQCQGGFVNFWEMELKYSDVGQDPWEHKNRSLFSFTIWFGASRKGQVHQVTSKETNSKNTWLDTTQMSLKVGVEPPNHTILLSNKQEWAVGT